MTTDVIHGGVKLLNFYRNHVSQRHCSIRTHQSRIFFTPKSFYKNWKKEKEIKKQVASMMSLKWTPPSFLMFLLMISVAVAQQDGRVYYTQNYICAGRGSTVSMSCNLVHHSSQVVKAFWSKDFIDLSSDPKYKDRVEYIRDTEHDCSLRLRNITKEDQRIYHCTFLTSAGKQFEGTGVSLSVTELKVETFDRVIEGHAVTLSCKTTCRLTTTPTFTWYKNGEQLYTYNKLLHLQSVTQKDAGNYSCAILGHNYQSPAVTLEVQYPPKRVSVTISPSGEIVEGSSVTLTCSSDANPPVQSYTWYKVKESSPVGSGQSYSFTLTSSSSGWFYCVAQNIHGSQRAPEVGLTSSGLSSGYFMILVGVVGVVLCVVATFIAGVFCLRRKRQNMSNHENASPPEDPYMTLDPRFISSDYANLTAARNQQ
ncbi:B-cell receptor CD22-like isoform X2 [Tachysurus fulvidraco]|uniref:B-cell receptor CD22-like isoform X2 n=1 Tax=Tachysurus fulvidraco TaxID=1234273 RepID=UPI001FEE1DC0|nr:B-cell receptor CD22-like isoform X2 [Tachysurus fulvidraco]